MNKTIRNLDKEAYKALKARATLTGKAMGEVVSETIRCYLARPDALPKQGSLKALRPERYPKGNEHLSEEIDTIQYGI
jgi:plasmid stability protein